MYFFSKIIYPNCLEKNLYDQLVGIITKYDYDFNGRLYKIIITNDKINSINNSQTHEDTKIYVYC